jgi:hypothetical protein
MLPHKPLREAHIDINTKGIQNQKGTNSRSCLYFPQYAVPFSTYPLFQSQIRLQIKTVKKTMAVGCFFAVLYCLFSGHCLIEFPYMSIKYPR